MINTGNYSLTTEYNRNNIQNIRNTNVVSKYQNFNILQKDVSNENSDDNELKKDSLYISEEGKKSQKAMLQQTNEVEQQEDFTSDEENDISFSTQIAVNVSKISRKIASAKTKEQLRAVMSEIRKDMQQVKAGIENATCDQAELNKVNALMNTAQQRMGNVEDRQATPEEQSDFEMSSIM